MLLRIFLILTVLLGGGSVYLLMQQYLRNAEREVTEQIRQANNLKNVLTFNKNLVRGTKITEADIIWEERKADTIPFGTIVREDDTDALSRVINTVVSQTVAKGEIVIPEILLASGAGFMALAIRPGMRAIAFKASQLQMVGGFVQPEDRVDIVHTVIRDLDGDGIANGISEVLISNVRVLAVGDIPTQRTVNRTNAEQKSKEIVGTEPLQADKVTLELSEEQVTLLISAATTGTITFSLRPVGNPIEVPKVESNRTIQEEQDEINVYTITVPNVETENKLKTNPAKSQSNEAFDESRKMQIVVSEENENVVKVITPSKVENFVFDGN